MIKNLGEILDNSLGFVMPKSKVSILSYKGYQGSININKDGTYWGKVLNNSNLCCVYEGKSLSDLEDDFHEMIDF